MTFFNTKEDSSNDIKVTSLDSLLEVASEHLLQCEETLINTIEEHTRDTFKAVKYNDTDILAEALKNTNINVNILCNQYHYLFNNLSSMNKTVYTTTRLKYENALNDFKKEGILKDNIGTKGTVVDYKRVNSAPYYQYTTQLINETTKNFNIDGFVEKVYAVSAKDGSCFNRRKVKASIYTDNQNASDDEINRVTSCPVYKAELTEKLVNQHINRMRDFNNEYAIINREILRTNKFLNLIQESFERIPEMFISENMLDGYMKKYNTVFIDYLNICSYALRLSYDVINAHIKNFNNDINQSVDIILFAIGNQEVFVTGGGSK